MAYKTSPLNVLLTVNSLYTDIQHNHNAHTWDCPISIPLLNGPNGGLDKIFFSHNSLQGGYFYPYR